MKLFIKVLLVVSIMGLIDMGLVFSALAGDVIKPSLKGQENKYRKAGDPKPGEEAQEIEEEAVERRRGPHDDVSDRFGRRLGPDDVQDDLGRQGNRNDSQDGRFGRQGGRYDGRDGRYGREGGRYDGQDGRFDRGGQQFREQDRNNERQYGRSDQAPTRRPQGFERRLDSHFRNHFRQSRHYRQAYRSSFSGRFRHFNNSRYRSDIYPGRGLSRSSRFLPNRFR
jgi:hypothetical protein